MTISSSFALFVAMLVLAILPGPGILIVVARTLSQGLRAGLITVAGILSADFIFIFLAVLGLAALAQSIGELFFIIKIAGAVYLIWLGLAIMRSQSSPSQQSANQFSQLGHYVAGLITTLSNPKAILFYMSFFPTFLDLTQVKPLDIFIILFITTLSIGSVMFAYAYLTYKTGKLVQAWPAAATLKYISGSVLIGTGAYIASK